MGGLGGFASATLAMLKKEFAGGGVLIDLGFHVFDQLLAVLGGEIEVVDCRDDSHGGVEADCEITAGFARPQASVEGTIRLSRVRNLSNMLRVECEHAILEVAVSERFAVTVRPIDPERAPFSVRGLGPTDVSWYESYRAGIDDFIKAISGEFQHSGRSVLPVMRAIETYLATRRSLATPWIDAMPSLSPTAQAPPRSNYRRRRVHRRPRLKSLRSTLERPGLVHNPASTSRPPMPIELVHGDLKSDDVCVARSKDAKPSSVRWNHTVTRSRSTRSSMAPPALGLRANRSVRQFVHISSIGVTIQPIKA